MQIHELLQAKANELGYTNAKIAKLTGFSLVTVYKTMRGVINSQINTVLGIAKVLNLKLTLVEAK